MDCVMWEKMLERKKGEGVRFSTKTAVYPYTKACYLYMTDD